MTSSPSDPKSAAIIEIGESHFAKYVTRWRNRIEAIDASEMGDFGAYYAALRDAISMRQARCIGVAVDDWIDATSCDDRHRSDAKKWLREIDDDGLGALWNEPHTLGWFHQHFGLSERQASNRAHTKNERKHRTQTTTTRLYTPRWVADFLANSCLEQLDPGDRNTATVCDPAVGGGQMLIAVLEAMIERGAAPEVALSQLHGVDLDPAAVEITFRNLAMHAARHLGRRDRSAETVLRTHLHVGDGLFDDSLFKDTRYKDTLLKDTSFKAPSPKFDIVLANPPYMGSRSMPVALKKKISNESRPFHADLYTAFIRRCHQLSGKTLGILAQQTVWYLSRFERARAWLLDEAELVEFMHLGAGAFHNLSGEKANVVAFVQNKRTAENRSSARQPTRFVDLRQLKGAQAKREAFAGAKQATKTHESPLVYRESSTAFDRLPGRVLAYWLPKALRELFTTTRRLADIAAIPGSQNKTGRNREFIKKWHAVDTASLRATPEIIGDNGTPDGRWVFYSKGGPFSPWWGNWQHIIDWSERARRFYDDNPNSNLLAAKWWFKEGICYTDFGGRRFNARWMPPGCLFDMTGPAIFPHNPARDHLFALLAILNSTPVRALLNAMNPSLHYQVRDLRNLPIPEFSKQLESTLADGARQLVRGQQLASTLEPTSPRSVCENPENADAIAAFRARRPALEKELNQMVCRLYNCPELVDAK